LVNDIYPFLKEIKYLKLFFIKFLRELIDKELELSNKHIYSDIIHKNRILDGLINYNLFLIFKKISNESDLISSNNILFFIGKYIIENDSLSKNLIEKFNFDPDYPKDYENEVSKLITLHDQDCDEKLNFEEFSNLLNINFVTNHEYQIDFNSYDSFNIIAIENENLNYILINLFTDYFKFIKFFHNKINYYTKICNFEIFDVFLFLDKRNINKISYEDFKNHIDINDFNTCKKNESRVKLLFEFFNIFKDNRNKTISINYEKDTFISIYEFEKVFSVRNNVVESYNLFKDFKTLKSLKKNTSKKDFTEVKQKEKFDFINNKKDSNGLGNTITSLEVSKLSTDCIKNTFLSENKLKTKIQYFKDYLAIFIEIEQILERLRCKIATKSSFNPKKLFEYLIFNDLEYNILRELEKKFNIENILNPNNNYEDFYFSLKDSICEHKNTFIINVKNNLDKLEIYLTKKEIEIFCSCFDYLSIKKFIYLFISNFDNSFKIVIDRILKDNQEQIEKTDINNNKITFNFCKKFYIDEETRIELNTFIEKLVFYEDKKEFFRKKIYEISNDYLDLFHFLDQNEKGFLIENDVIYLFYLFY